jgi:hypothetical protein
MVVGRKTTCEADGCGNTPYFLDGGGHRRWCMDHRGPGDRPDPKVCATCFRRRASWGPALRSVRCAGCRHATDITQVCGKHTRRGCGCTTCLKYIAAIEATGVAIPGAALPAADSVPEVPDHRNKTGTSGIPTITTSPATATTGAATTTATTAATATTATATTNHAAIGAGYTHDAPGSPSASRSRSWRSPAPFVDAAYLEREPPLCATCGETEASHGTPFGGEARCSGCAQPRDVGIVTFAEDPCAACGEARGHIARSTVDPGLRLCLACADVANGDYPAAAGGGLWFGW